MKQGITLFKALAGFGLVAAAILGGLWLFRPSSPSDVQVAQAPTVAPFTPAPYPLPSTPMPRPPTPTATATPNVPRARLSTPEFVQTSGSLIVNGLSGDEVLARKGIGANSQMILFDLNLRRETPLQGEARLHSNRWIVSEETSPSSYAGYYRYLKILDRTTGREIKLGSGDDFRTNPSLSGNVLVWMDSRKKGSGGGIYGYDLAANKEFPIIPDADGGFVGTPRLSGRWLAYLRTEMISSATQKKPAQLRAYHVDTHENILIYEWADTGRDGVTYVLGGTRVVWEAWDTFHYRWTIHVYDLATRTERVVDYPAHAASPRLSDSGEFLAFSTATEGYVFFDLVRWEKFAAGTRVIDGRALNPPFISGHWVLWAASDNAQAIFHRIYLSRILR